MHQPPSMQLTESLMDLLKIQGESGNETQVVDYLKKRLLSFGVKPECIQQDNAQTQSEYGGACGNLIVHLDGTGEGERFLFGAHMDTVAIAIGAQPQVDGQRIINKASGKALGGDNRTGCAILLELARTMCQRNGDHAPLSLVFFVQEETGLIGSRGLNLESFKDRKPTRFYNFDSGSANELTTAVTGTERYNVIVTGNAVHAGINPEDGVSAAIIAGKAMAELAAQGWHGAIQKPDGCGSANVGIMKGGLGSNVVMGELYLLIEARSHDSVFRKKIITQWQQVFQKAAQSEKNSSGKCGAVEFTKGPAYESFHTPADAAIVKAVHQAASTLGFDIKNVSNNGGMDTNRLAAKGIPSVTIGCGQRQVHTVDEWIDLNDFARAFGLALKLALNR